jgi:hypothetical protein
MKTAAWWPPFSKVTLCLSGNGEVQDLRQHRLQNTVLSVVVSPVLDYRDCYAYQDANFGYDGYYEDQGAYNHYFREGFRRGYEDGYYSRYQ